MSSATINLGGADPLKEPETHSNVEAVSVYPTRLREFDSLWEGCRVSVRAYLSSLMSNKSDVEDCIQEVALIAWKKGPIEAGQRAFLGHCLASARLIGLAATRKVGKSKVQFLPPGIASALADEVMRQEQEQVPHSNRIHALRGCMALLNEQQRGLLSLRYACDGRGKLEESARSQGRSPDAIYKMLERLRATLRECVSKRMEGENDAS
jgi:RNA polymerase sigma-70 factor (ECF subfamily)